MTFADDIARALSDSALADALELARTHLKQNPTDQAGRHLYIDLLVVAGDYDQADNQCSLAVTFAPNAAMGFALLRNELRGMAARDAWFASGAVPQFPQGVTPLDTLALRIGLAHRLGDGAETRQALQRLEASRGERSFVLNGAQVADLRDLDDRTPHALEVIMTGGVYLWVDFSKIARLDLDPIARPRDLAFRRAQLRLTDGSVAPVLLPAIYHSTGDDPELRLGRRTEWNEESTGIITGRGQRCFLAGDDVASLHEVTSLAVAQADAVREVAHG